LSRKDDWPFLYRTAEIVSVTGETDYALPSDFGSLQNLFIGEIKAEIYSPQDAPLFVNGNGFNSSHPIATIRQLTVSPFWSQGTVYPTFDSSEVTGVGTGFDSRVVGRFFKSKRDGEIYRVRSISDALTIQLMQDFKGKSQAGRVSIYGNGTTSGDLSIVYGSPNVTNFTADMTGRYINIQGQAAPIEIASVDVLRQRLTLVTPVTVQGTDLIYSVQDDYEIDPPGQFILQILPESADDITDISVDYIAIQTDMTSDYDVPIVPVQFHQVIQFGAVAEAMRITNWPDANTISMYEQRYENGIVSLMGYDPLGSAVEITAEPDVLRLGRSGVVR